jgi:hypothetical protein
LQAGGIQTVDRHGARVETLLVGHKLGIEGAAGVSQGAGANREQGILAGDRAGGFHVDADEGWQVVED